MKCKERGEARLPHERGAEGFLRKPAGSEKRDTPNLHNLLGFLRMPRCLTQREISKAKDKNLDPVLPPAAQIQVSEIT